MNDFKNTVLNADIPVMCIGLCIHIYVQCVIQNSVKKGFL